MDYFAPKLSPDDLRAISAIGLAHMGDAVYELLVRTWPRWRWSAPRSRPAAPPKCCPC